MIDHRADFWSTVQERRRERLLVELLNSLNGVGIEGIVVKGWSIARFYPNERPRPYGDIDIAVDPRDYQPAKSHFENTIKGTNWDLHEGLRDRDNRPWEEIFSRSYKADIDGVSVRVLGDEDNLRVAAAHWLLDGGLYKDRLWDIYYLVGNRKEDFDWELCLNVAGVARKTWVMAAIATARDYLGLDVSGLPEEVKAFSLPKWYTDALKREWERGPYLRVYLVNTLLRPGEFINQLKRRFPPNPIAATTDVEGIIDDSPRFRFQILSVSKKVRAAVSSLLHLRKM